VLVLLEAHRQARADGGAMRLKQAWDKSGRQFEAWDQRHPVASIFGGVLLWIALLVVGFCVGGRLL
jgi:hypothetical protein